jgi:hypothetical protein
MPDHALDLAVVTFPHIEGAERAYADVPEGSSAVMLLATPEHADAMVAAFGPSHGQLVRHHLTAEQATALEHAVADSSDAATARMPSSQDRAPRSPDVDDARAGRGRHRGVP